MSAELDLYKILGVERNASDAEIKKVRRGKGIYKSFLFMLYFVSIVSVLCSTIIFYLPKATLNYILILNQFGILFERHEYDFFIYILWYHCRITGNWPKNFIQVSDLGVIGGVSLCLKIFYFGL